MDDIRFEEEDVAAWTDGPLVLGVSWRPSLHVVDRAAGLAAALGVHLICAFVDPAGYLAELESVRTRMASSIDPGPNQEALFPAADVRVSLEAVLGPPGKSWSLRVLNGSVAEAIARLADSTGASAIVVGGPRRGVGAGLNRVLESSVSARLVRIQRCPVIVVPAA